VHQSGPEEPAPRSSEAGARGCEMAHASSDIVGVDPYEELGVPGCTPSERPTVTSSGSPTGERPFFAVDSVHTYPKQEFSSVGVRVDSRVRSSTDDVRRTVRRRRCWGGCWASSTATPPASGPAARAATPGGPRWRWRDRPLGGLPPRTA